MDVGGALDSSQFTIRMNAAGFPVVVRKDEKWEVPVDDNNTDSSKKGGNAQKERVKTRLTKESGSRVQDKGVKIGGPFEPKENPEFIATRAALWDRLYAVQESRLAKKPKQEIQITLPDGKVLNGTSWETTPMMIAQSISKGLAQQVVVAKVKYSNRIGIEAEDGLNMINAGLDEDMPEIEANTEGELWDLNRPLEGDCNLSLLKFEDKEGKMVFWHSSAHVLGECMECKYGVKLCIGPPTEDGFYYDGYMGQHTISETDYPVLKSKAAEIIKEKQVFERLVLTKDEALDMFADNPFKVQLIQTKIPDGSYTTAYKCGPLIDLCPGPHVPTTGLIKSFEITKHSASYWLANVENDVLQRVYGISFPDAKQMKAYLHMIEEAKKRDHRLLGQNQELFFFHELSPGSSFFLPHGTRVYNKLMDHIRNQYRSRGFHEVITPNMYNIDLWKISGHADHYLENMFTFVVEEQDWAVKPMNCPGHCIIFDNRVRSYRELPWRIADFGVLHRNELSGALSGLTRVRRFQQDDAHIFCRPDQIAEEVAGALDFMDHTYGIFGFKFDLELSTRPENALGDPKLWDRAEDMMKEALEKFGRPWRLNPGDGAFYGPKIDIKVLDALGRRHQCATIQLDFQLPVRFNLRYRAAGTTHADENEDGEQQAVAKKKKKVDTSKAIAAALAENPGDGVKAQSTNAVSAMVAHARSGIDILPDGYERPVMIHRAVLGSVERFMAMLIEHTAGKWPFWLSPRQISIVPVSLKFMDYARHVEKVLYDAGYFVDVDGSNSTMNKKIRAAQLAQYNFILVVGEQEATANTVNIRTRDNKRHGTKSIDEFLEMAAKLVEEYK